MIFVDPVGIGIEDISPASVKTATIMSYNPQQQNNRLGEHLDDCYTLQTPSSRLFRPIAVGKNSQARHT